MNRDELLQALKLTAPEGFVIDGIGEISWTTTELYVDTEDAAVRVELGDLSALLLVLGAWLRGEGGLDGEGWQAAGESAPYVDWSAPVDGGEPFDRVVEFGNGGLADDDAVQIELTEAQIIAWHQAMTAWLLVQDVED